jgi:hypothetical protein
MQSLSVHPTSSGRLLTSRVFAPSPQRNDCAEGCTPPPVVLLRFSRSGASAPPGLHNSESATDGQCIAVVAHAAGSAPFTPESALCQGLFAHVAAVYSLVLPFHGEQSLAPCDEAAEQAVIQGLRSVNQALEPVVRGRMVLLVGVSMGGIVFIHAFKSLYTIMDPRSLCIVIGGALLCASTRDVLEFFEQMRDRPTHAQRAFLNGAHARPTTTLHFVVSCANSHGLFFHSAQQVEQLRHCPSFARMHFIHGKQDVFFPWVELATVISAERLRVLDSVGHFDYMKRPAWPVVQHNIDDIVRQHAAAVGRRSSAL